MLGLCGIMMPGNPAVADCHDAMYDSLWAVVDLGLPLSFLILRSHRDAFKVGGPAIGDRHLHPASFEEDSPCMS